MGETLELGRATVDVEARAGYLYMVEHGLVVTVPEVRAYTRAMERLVERHGIRLALIDARGTEGTEPAPGARDAMWEWLVSGAGFRQVAFVISNEMTVARVNMLALSARANVRAFSNVPEASRWLTGRVRSASSAYLATSSSVPPGSTIPPSGERRTSSTFPPATPASDAPFARPRSTFPPAPSASPPSVVRTGRFSALPDTPSSSPGRVATPVDDDDGRSRGQHRSSGAIVRSDVLPAYDPNADESTRSDGTRRRS